MDDGVREKDHLLLHAKGPDENVRPIHVYRRRWWILGIVSYVGGLQCMMWNSFGPITHSMEVAFGWTNADIAFITNLANVGYTVFVIPVGMFMEAKGLRLSTLLSALLLLLCCFARCVTLQSKAFTAFAYASSFFVGIAGIVPYGGPSMVAAVWFPANERTLAAAIVSFSNYLGISLQFIVGPLFVQDPVYISIEEGSNAYNQVVTTSNENVTSNTFVIKNLEEIRAGFAYMIYYHTASAALLLLVIFLHFPAKPPKPPSVTASIQRVKYWSAVKQLVGNRQLWLVMVIGAFPKAIVGTWIAVFDIVAKELGVSQVDAGWIGFLHLFIGCSSGIVFAKFADHASGYKKTIVVVTTCLSVIFGTWTTLICNRLLSFDLGSLYVSCFLFGVMVNGTVPLFYELCAETAYPVGEGITGSMYTLIVHVFAITYLAVASVLNDDVDWLTWTSLASVVIILPLFLFYKVQNKRSDIDREQRMLTH